MGGLLGGGGGGAKGMLPPPPVILLGVPAPLPPLPTPMYSITVIRKYQQQHPKLNSSKFATRRIRIVQVNKVLSTSAKSKLLSRISWCLYLIINKNLS